ncbi:MAG: glycoside hydrolase family 18 protein [Bacteroidota bacterium]
MISSCFVTELQGQQKEIIGYYPSWKWRHKNSLMTHEKIPYNKLTIINYAFWYPMPDGKLVGRDTVGDNLILKRVDGKPSMIDLAHKNNVKVMLSLGGWEDSGNFPAVAATSTTRANFAHACVNVIKEYGFDGIDIDWEYPGYADHNGTPADKQNFTLLLKVTRDSLEAHGKKIGKKLLLTAALPASADGLVNYEIKQVAELLDLLNIMTYDFNGSWSPMSGHNAPLFAPNKNDSLRNIDASFRFYTKTLGISPEKINLGIPFYGHTYTQCTSLNTSHNGADTSLFLSAGAFYYDIIKHVDKFNRYWDASAKVPYLIIPGIKTLISYDDEESVAYKAQYVIDNKVRGVIIWEITGDYLNDGTTPLLNVVHSKLNSGSGTKK